MDVLPCVHLLGKHRWFSLGNGPILALFLLSSGFGMQRLLFLLMGYVFLAYCVYGKGKMRVTGEPQEQYGYRDCREQ